jgi:hypothetical protein
MTPRRYRPPVLINARQRGIAACSGPWTRPDYLTSAVARAIDAAWVKASQWDYDDWKRRDAKRARPQAEMEAP